MGHRASRTNWPMKPGCKRMARLMKQAGLRGLNPKNYVPQTTQSDHDQLLAPNRLAERAAPEEPNQIWSTT